MSEPNAMGKQGLFQSLYTKYSRRNVYSDVYSKVFASWVSASAADGADFSVCLSESLCYHECGKGVSAYY